LRQLELLLLEQTHAVSGVSPVCTLLGYDQGACMALALAALWPERVSAIIAIGGYWPKVNDWEIPYREMRLPALMIPDRATESNCAVDAASELHRRGAAVSGVRHAHCATKPDWEWLALTARSWLARIANLDRQEVSSCVSIA
jgi:pimeloyl-ACP methyl ester carboxylesterase